jgi:hypothetical protein
MAGKMTTSFTPRKLNIEITYVALLYVTESRFFYFHPVCTRKTQNLTSLFQKPGLKSLNSVLKKPLYSANPHRQQQPIAPVK